MKHLPKHVRPRWRYLAVGIETWPDADLDRRAFQRALWHAAANLLGDPGSADADLRLMAFDFADGRGEAIVRVRRGEVEPARAALACVESVGDAPAGLRVRGVSGTVRACEEKYMGGPPETPKEKRVVFRQSTRPAVARGALLDVESEDGYAGVTRLDLDSE